MKVKELIALLQKEDPEATVLKEYDGGFNDVFGTFVATDVVSSSLRKYIEENKFTAVVIE